MSNLILFEENEVRRVWNETEQKWYFSVQDVVALLTDSLNVKDYIKKMKKRDDELNLNWGTICPLVEMVANDGKKRKIQAANGMTPSEYKKHKELTRPTENLRDHMTDLELIFTMLGEASTTEIAREKDTLGFAENKDAAIQECR